MAASETMFFAEASDRKLFESKKEITSTKTAHDLLEDVYEIRRTISEIVKHAYRVVALQFPDDMLADAQCVSDTIASGVNAQSPDTPKESGDACRVFVLGDTTYGSCCVDTVAAEHVKASLIVHYGESCQSLVTKVPVLYIYGRAEFATNMDETVKSLRENITEGSRVVVLYECKWQWRMQGLCKALAEFAHVTMSVLRSEATGEEDNATTVLGRLIPCEKSDEPHHEANRGTLDEASSSEETTDDNEGGLYNFSDTTVVWVGPQGRTLTALMLNMPSAHRFVSYNPQTHDCLLEGATVNKSLMRRYFLVEKCKQAQTVGILVGTLGIAHHNELLAHIKTILKAAGKKFYTIVIGKINGPKVANFLEVDAYVLVACAENSLVDSKEFSVPIVTPFEMELACTRGREWPGRLRTDLEEVLPQLSAAAAETHNATNEDDDVPEFSALTGTYVYRPSAQQTTTTSREVQTRAGGELVATGTAAEYMMTRTFKGLEIREGETPVVKAVEGRGGIARGYQGEGSNHDNTPQ